MTKQLLAKIGIDLLFVAGSILAYNIGHKAGEMISNRVDNELKKEDNELLSENNSKMTEYAA